MSKKFVFPLIIFLFLFSFSVLAQEADIEEDAIVTVEELNIEEPGIISWFKNAADTIQLWMTSDPIKKSEIELRKASRQLVKTRNMVQENFDDVNLQAKIERVNNRYENNIRNINGRIEEFSQNNPEDSKLKSFLNKYSSQQLKHQEILKKLEENVPEDAMIKIQENRQIYLDKFGEVMSKLQDKEEFKESLKNSLESSQSAIRQVQMMEIIEELGDQAILGVKEMVQEMKQENKEFFQNLDAERIQIQERIQSRIHQEETSSGDDSAVQQQSGKNDNSSQDTNKNGKTE